MIIDHTHGLHIGIANSRADKFKSLFLERLTHGIRLGCAGRYICHGFPAIVDRFAIHERPDIAIKATILGLYL